MHQPGTAPRALERVVAPLEQRLFLLEGISAIESRIEHGAAVLTITVVPEVDASAVLADIERSVEASTEDGVELQVHGELRFSRRMAIVEEPAASDLGHPAVVVTAIARMLDAVGLDLETLGARIRDGLGERAPSIEALSALRVEGLSLDGIVTLERAGGPRVEDAHGDVRFLRAGEGPLLVLNDCDGAAPVEGFVRARIETQADNRSHEERRRMAAALMAMARDAGHTPYLLLDLDLDAAIAGRPSTRFGATEVVVFSDAPELAAAWRARELPGAALTVDANDVRRLRVSVEQAQSGAVLARLATSPDVAELLPSPRARGRMVAEVNAEDAARAGASVEALERLAEGSLAGIELLPGLTLKGPALDTIRIGRTDEAPGVPLTEFIALSRTFDAPLSRADGRPVQHFEARILPATDRQALLNQVLGR